MIKAGAFAINITPQKSIQLAGYPFVKRKSTGVHDPLFATALYIEDGSNGILFISCDLIYVGKHVALNVREKIKKQYGIPSSNIMITATHTHSGPSTVNFVAGSHDNLLAPVDKEYVAYIETQLFEAAGKAIEKTVHSEIGFSVADVTGIGTNRHNPEAVADLNAPVMIVRRKADQSVMACMIICSMHPTVLHQDSNLVSGDFPGLARKLLQEQYFDEDTVFLFQLGTAGNQSPRHVTTANTFEEAKRLATILAQAITKSMVHIQYEDTVIISVIKGDQKLVRKKFPSISVAKDYVDACKQRLETAIATNQPSQQIRSAEVNWFGAKELAQLSMLATNGQLEKVYQQAELIEILIFKIGRFTMVGWPGEIFVEYGLEIKNNYENTAVITLMNGELQGYIVTPDAATTGVYESSNAIFDPESGSYLVNKTKELLREL